MQVSRWSWVVLLVSVLGCAGESEQKPLTRSPSTDYRTDQPRTADGRPLGADGINPGDRLAAGAKVGEEGPELAPGWYVEEGKLKYDPERRDDPGTHPPSAKKKKAASPKK